VQHTKSFDEVSQAVTKALDEDDGTNFTITAEEQRSG